MAPVGWRTNSHGSRRTIPARPKTRFGRPAVDEPSSSGRGTAPRGGPASRSGLGAVRPAWTEAVSRPHVRPRIEWQGHGQESERLPCLSNPADHVCHHALEIWRP